MCSNYFPHRKPIACVRSSLRKTRPGPFTRAKWVVISVKSSRTSVTIFAETIPRIPTLNFIFKINRCRIFFDVYFKICLMMKLTSKMVLYRLKRETSCWKRVKNGLISLSLWSMFTHPLPNWIRFWHSDKNCSRIFAFIYKYILLHINFISWHSKWLRKTRRFFSPSPKLCLGTVYIIPWL